MTRQYQAIMAQLRMQPSALPVVPTANPLLTDHGFLGITRLAGPLTRLVLEGGHGITENGATALAALTGLQALSLAYRCAAFSSPVPPRHRGSAG